MRTAAYDAAARVGMRSTQEQLLEEYLPLIRYHADQLLRRTPDSIDRNDLINSGVLGLLDGASRFEADRGIQLKTFISYRIRGAMIDYLRSFDWLPRTLRDSSKELQAALFEVQQLKGRPAEEEEIAQHLGISLPEYRNRLDQVRSMSVVYFDDLPGAGSEEDEMDILEVIAGDSSQAPDRLASLNQFVASLAAAIEQLPQREAILLTLYYYEELSMKEVALVLGLTESRVSQLHSQMVLRLRKMMNLDADLGSVR